MSGSIMNELVDNYINTFNDMPNSTKVETFKFNMIEVYKKILEMAENDKDATQFFINVIAIMCSIDIKGISEKKFIDLICSVIGDVVNYKQFYKMIKAFDKDKSALVQFIKVLHDFDDETKEALFKSVGCIITYYVTGVQENVKEKFLNFMLAVND